MFKFIVVPFLDMERIYDYTTDNDITYLKIHILVILIERTRRP